MSSIFSCFTRQSSVDTLQAFQKSVDKTDKDNRVSSSNLNNLLKDVKNSPKQLTFAQYKEIKKHVASLDVRLGNQHSNLYEKKDAKISKALELAISKLTPSAQSERARENIQAQVDEAKKSLPTLEKNVLEAENKLKSSVENLPTAESQKKAWKYISDGNYSMFSKDAAIADKFFPTHTKQVERGNGSVIRNQKFEHSGKTAWAAIHKWCINYENENNSLQNAKKVIAENKTTL